MDLSKLFEMQKVLDDHIIDEHPELKGQNNLDWKILALQVELGECANEWRGFKKWSKDQEPRTTLRCSKCDGKGYIDWFSGSLETNDLQQNMDVCDTCRGTGEDKDVNPLLEEYVDCLHFILSIGLELLYLGVLQELPSVHRTTIKEKTIMQQFKEVMRCTLRVEMTVKFDIFSTEHAYKNLLDYYFGLGEMLGFNCEQIEQAYFEKNKVNHARQNNGY